MKLKLIGLLAITLMMGTACSRKSKNGKKGVAGSQAPVVQSEEKKAEPQKAKPQKAELSDKEDKEFSEELEQLFVDCGIKKSIQEVSILCDAADVQELGNSIVSLKFTNGCSDIAMMRGNGAKEAPEALSMKETSLLASKTEKIESSVYDMTGEAMTTYKYDNKTKEITETVTMEYKDLDGEVLGETITLKNKVAGKNCKISTK